MTYQLLGEICLDKHDYSQAIDFFQRVLSADPENFIARVGLSICFDEGGSLEEAIWQLERAFELNPGSVEVRNELRRLYTQRDGTEVAKIKLNAGALGRLYAKGEFFQLAVAEFRSLLQQDPQLVDIQVALAETLWRDGRRTEAAELCTEIIKQLPNCLKANLILADIALQSERPEEGQAKLELARALDPAGTLARELLGERSPLSLQEAMLPALDEAVLAAAAPKPAPTAGPAEEAPEEEEIAWLRELEAQPQEVAPTAEEEAEMPEWLRALRTGAEETPAIAAEKGAVEELWQEQPSAAEAPAGEEMVTGAEEEIALESVPVSEGEEIEIPEWLRGLGEEVEEVEGTAAQEPAAVPAEEIPEWLRQLKPQEAEEKGEEAEGEEVPAWLRGMVEELPVEEEAEEAGETPAWLRELAGAPEVEEKAPPIIAEEQVLQAAEPAEEIPEWLLALKPEGTEEVPVEPSVTGKEELPAAEAGEGLIVEQLPQEMTFEQLVAEVAPELAAQLPEWMGEKGEKKAEVEEELAVAEAGPYPPVEEVPEWLQEAGPEVAEAEAPAMEKELPEWLHELEPEEVEELAPPEVLPVGIAEEEVFLPEIPPAESEVAEEEEIPEWLRQLRLETTERVSAAEPAEEIPEWLRELKPALPEETLEITETPLVEAAPSAVEEAEMPEGMPDWLHELREAAAEEEVETITAPLEMEEEIPEWLRELKPVIPGEELVSEAVTMPPEEAEEIPAWLRQAESPPETPSAELLQVETTTEEERVPSWLRELKAVEEVLPKEAEEKAPVEVEPEFGEAEEAPEWLRELEAEVEKLPPELFVPAGERVEEEAGAEEVVALAEVPSEEVVAAPELREELPPELAVEEEVAVTEAVVPEEVVAGVVAPVPGEEIAVAEEAVTAEAEAMPAAEETAIREAEALVAARPSDHHSRLALARLYRDAARWDAARAQYEKLVKAGALVDAVIEDIEQVMEQHPADYATCLLLGDAYMKDGRLQKALNAYREAMSKL
jgi:tetratricopeptide (TPR) repeat protein